MTVASCVPDAVEVAVAVAATSVDDDGQAGAASAMLASLVTAINEPEPPVSALTTVLFGASSAATFTNCCHRYLQIKLFQ